MPTTHIASPTLTLTAKHEPTTQGCFNLTKVAQTYECLKEILNSQELSELTSLLILDKKFTFRTVAALQEVLRSVEDEDDMKHFKSIDEIRTAVAAGQVVYWRSNSYQLIQDSTGMTYIRHINGASYPLMADHNPEDFFTEGGTA